MHYIHSVILVKCDIKTSTPVHVWILDCTMLSMDVWIYIPHDEQITFSMMSMSSVYT